MFTKAFSVPIIEKIEKINRFTMKQWLDMALKKNIFQVFHEKENKTLALCGSF